MIVGGQQPFFFRLQWVQSGVVEPDMQSRHYAELCRDKTMEDTLQSNEDRESRTHDLIYDISLTVTDDMPVWPSDPKVAINKRRAIEEGDSCNVTQLDMGSHTGTHIDAPYHFEDDGKGIDGLDLKTLVGQVSVVDTADKDVITLSVVNDLYVEGTERLLFKTKNSGRWRDGKNGFTKDYVAMTGDAARFLVDAGVKLVGIDYLSIERFGCKGHETHHTLLGNGVIVIEGLNLADVAPGDYELTALPLKIKGGDGSPARVILRQLRGSH